MNYKNKKYRYLRHILAMPFITAPIIPLIIADIFTEIYHRVCFPLYGMKYVKRSKFITIDRHKLKYLTIFQKLYCVYCGYANGLIAYIREIAGKTESYWCGIRHEQIKGRIEQEHQKNFLKYNDKKAFDKFIKK